MNPKTSDVKHLAIIMDGNARWAEEKNLPKLEGHRNGVEAIRKLLKPLLELDIQYITLYAFSLENWKRGAEEVSWLMYLLSFYLKKELASLNKNGVRLKVIGRLDLLSLDLQNKINEAILLTENNMKMTLCIACSYGGRAEIVDACQKIIDSGKKEINETDFKNYLYDPEMPDVDLLIRTSGDLRISNFLLWHASYAELYFTSKYWPDFDKEDLSKAIEDYSKRKRNFGGRG